MALGGGGRGKENDRESTMSKCIKSVQVDDTTICTESCQVMGGERARVRENNRRS
jgi:hypothetical protein